LSSQAKHSSLNQHLRAVDPEIAEAIKREEKRQHDKLVLIASENYTSRAVLEAQGSVMTNKYAEGYPGRRYYGGCENVDTAESLAIERAKQLFGADHANVQPHSGAIANLAVYLAFMKPGDTYMALDLAHGGHLTHGSPVNFSGRLYNAVHYGVDPETELINYDTVREIAKKHKPKILVTGASCYPRFIDFTEMRRISDEVGALFMVDMAHIAGMVAAGEHPSPIPHAHIVTTTTHKTLRGPRAGLILCKSEFAEAVDKSVFPGLQGGPLMHVIAAKAVCFKEAMTPEFVEYQRKTVANAKALAQALTQRGFRLVAGGTDTHLMLIDLTNKGITGKFAQEKLDSIGIVVNKNMIPFDKEKPFVTSGIRIGTPAVTTRGMQEWEMEQIADIISRVLDDPENQTLLESSANEVKNLCDRFPIYGETD